MTEKITWYSYNEQEQFETKPPVDLAGAVDIARRYYSYAGMQYDTKGAARAAKCFGLWRDDGTYIEIWAHGPDNISYTFKTDAPLATLNQVEQAVYAQSNGELVLKSWEELEEKIRQFYAEHPSEIRHKLAWQQAAVPTYKVVTVAAFFIYLFTGMFVYDSEVKKAVCGSKTYCKKTEATLIWPYYIWGPGAVRK